jgi:hypothetical protein
VEAWHESLELVAAWKPERLAMTHFGSSEDAAGQLEEVGRRLDDWSVLAREQDLDGFIAGMQREIAESANAEIAAAYTQAAPPEQLYAGLRRYWDKNGKP